MRISSLLLPVLGIVMSASAAIAGNTNAIPIAGVPFVANKPGNYKLTRNLTHTSGSAAITINARDVVLDLNGFSLIGGEDVSTSNVGVLVLSANTIVRNGTIRRFDTAITDTTNQSGGTIVEDVICFQQVSTGIRLQANDNLLRRVIVRGTGQQSGTPDSIAGILLSGSTVLENCQVQNIPSRENVSPIAGIRLLTSSFVVRECDIHRVIGTGLVINADRSTMVERLRVRECNIGISVIGGIPPIIRDSTVRDCNASTNGNFTNGGENNFNE